LADLPPLFHPFRPANPSLFRPPLNSVFQQITCLSYSPVYARVPLVLEVIPPPLLREANTFLRLFPHTTAGLLVPSLVWGVLWSALFAPILGKVKLRLFSALITIFYFLGRVRGDDAHLHFSFFGCSGSHRGCTTSLHLDLSMSAQDFPSSSLSFFCLRFILLLLR